jgi:uncharacterized hydrophobic protein (TIGR00271 family)
MPLLRITCPPDLTEHIVHLLRTEAEASELVVVAEARRVSPGDLVLADVPRAVVDELLERLPVRVDAPTLHVALTPSERLIPPPAEDDHDDDEVVWAQLVQDVHATAQLSWINILLMVIAAGIAAIGILEDQLLLVVGAMALSPDYFPLADTCLSLARGSWDRAARGFATLAVSLAAASLGAWILTEVLDRFDFVEVTTTASRELTLWISRPDGLTVVVALLAGVAGALAITLPDARGLVGVFVSITTIPAAANMGVAIAAQDGGEFAGAAIQLCFNVASLLVAGTLTLLARRRFGRPHGPGVPRPR